MTENIPAQFDHCLRVYALMERESRTEKFALNDSVEGPDGQHTVDVGERKVWEGHTTRIFNELMLSTPYYTSVMNHLKRMGCVNQLRRGGGSATSLWELVREPTLDLYEMRDLGNVNPTTLKGRVEALEKIMREFKRNQDIIMQHLGVKL